MLYLSQTIVPSLPDWADWIILAGLGWFLLDKVLSGLKSRGVDLVKMTKDVNDIVDEVKSVKEDMLDVKVKVSRLDESHHGALAMSADGYKWHNAKHITDKIKDTDRQISALKGDVHDIREICDYIKKSLD